MPYARNPLKYPEILHEILAHLMEVRPKELKLDCATPAEAQSRRIQIHSYFKAVERHAEELKGLADRCRQKMLAAQGKESSAAKMGLELDWKEAKGLAELWERRALAAMGWMVRASDSPPSITILRRSTSDTFAGSFAEAKAKAPPPGTPPAHVTEDFLEEQMRLLAQASAMMRGEAAAPPKPRQEEPSEEERLRQGRFRSREEAEEYLLRQRNLGNAAGK